MFTAAMLWLTVIVGTYVIFPPYRAMPPDGVTDLSQCPRALVLASPQTAWLHGFAMEITEHVPCAAPHLPGDRDAHRARPVRDVSAVLGIAVAAALQPRI